MSSRARLSTEAAEPFAWQPAGAPAGPAAASESPAAPADASDPQMRLAAAERDAFVKGYAQGERAGAEAAVARTEAMLRRLAQTIEELAAVRAQMIHQTERQLVQLVLAIAERVVHREITLDRSLLIGMARAALDRLGEHGSATIRLNPDDYHALRLADSDADEPRQIRIVPDPVVSRGGCLVRSDFGEMDVAPDAQFRELARALLADVDAPPPPDDGHALAIG